MSTGAGGGGVLLTLNWPSALAGREIAPKKA